MYTAKDIHIFLFTHNRASLLKEALESLRHQTLKNFRLTVLDNASTDNTRETVESFADINARYYKTPADIPLANLIYCQNLADTEFTLIFHDDDIMNPCYMENILKALNRFPQVSMVTSTFTYFYDNNLPQQAKLPQHAQSCYYFDNYKDYCINLWTEAFGCWSGSCARTKYFKQISFLFKEYGKLHDCPIMIETAKYGPVAVLAENNLFYTRLHSKRDSFNNANAITLEQFLNWVKLFYNCAGGGNINSPLWFLYAGKIEGVLKVQYDIYISPEIKQAFPFPRFMELIKSMGYISDDMLLFRNRRNSALNYIKALKFKFNKKITNPKGYLIKL